MNNKFKALLQFGRISVKGMQIFRELEQITTEHGYVIEGKMIGNTIEVKLIQGET